MKNSHIVAALTLTFGLLLSGCSHDKAPVKEPDVSVRTPSIADLREVASDFLVLLDEDRKKNGVYPQGTPEDITQRVTTPDGGPFHQFSKLSEYSTGNDGGSVKFTVKTMALPEGKNTYTYDSAASSKTPK